MGLRGPGRRRRRRAAPRRGDPDPPRHPAERARGDRRPRCVVGGSARSSSRLPLAAPECAPAAGAARADARPPRGRRRDGHHRLSGEARVGGERGQDLRDPELRRRGAPVRAASRVLADRLERLRGVRTAEAWGYAPAAFTRPGAIDVVRTYPDRGHGALVAMGPPPGTALVRFPLRSGAGSARKTAAATPWC